jgi:glutamate carboxypeptidase
LITSDEEIASPHSRKIIEREARLARCCFNSEPSKLDGANINSQVINSGRKGGAFMRLEVKGVAAHSGNSYEKGRSAVLDIAHKTKKLMQLTDIDKGVTINVGVISGGTTMNTVAPHAFIEFDIRYIKPKQRDKAMKQIRKICEKPYVEGTTSEFIIKGEFYPLVLNQDALDMQAIYSEAAKEIGTKVTTAFSGGCADSGFTSMVGCPTICSVGPSGGDWHTEREYVEISSILPAAQALALSVMRVARG